MKGIKVPFELHASVKATSQVVVKNATDLALSPDGATLAVLTRESIAFFEAGSERKALGDLASACGEHVEWSEDGTKIATLHGEWSGNDQAAQIAIYAWPDGRKLAEATMPKWGYFSHALGGSIARVMAFANDGARLFIRSSTRTDAYENAVGVLDIEGAFQRRELDTPETSIFSIAVDRDRLFVLFGDARYGGGLVWLDAKTLEPRGRVSVAGEQVVCGESGVWAIGDATWAWRVDTRAIEGGTASGRKALDARAAKAEGTLRWERLQQLSSRARAKWDVDYLASREPENVDATADAPGVRSLVHREPWGIPQAARFGADDVIVRDGVRVALWHERDRSLEVTPLIEDVQRATTSKARHLMLSVRGKRIALGWRKALSSNETTCTIFDVAL